MNSLRLTPGGGKVVEAVDFGVEVEVEAEAEAVGALFSVFLF